MCPAILHSEVQNFRQTKEYNLSDSAREAAMFVERCLQRQGGVVGYMTLS